MDKLSYYLMVRAVTNLATDMKGFLEATFLGTVMVKLKVILIYQMYGFLLSSINKANF